MFKQKPKPLSQITIYRQALIDNYNYFQKTHPQTIFAPVIKSNAYGHGLVEVAKIIDKYIKPPYVCVNDLVEAQSLQQNGIKTPILLLGYTPPHNFKTIRKLPFTFPVFDIETLKALNHYHPGTKVHIKIDTGMNRLGLKPNQWEEFIQAARQMDRLEFEGIYTHLSHADEKEGDDQTKKQLKIFKQALDDFRHWGFIFKWRHVANTAGASRLKTPDFNLSRLGLGFYGYSPFALSTPTGKKHQKHLKPALSLTSHIAQIKTLQTGEQVGYSGTFIAPNPMIIGILPIGYNDGLDRRLSNRGQAIVNQVVCNIIGRVSMNMTAIDLTQVTDPFVGQEVTIFSQKPSDSNTIEKAARKSHIICHDLLAGLNNNLARIIET